ncbi:MAG: mannitol dehydrogenase family protein [Clostridia bacterium]|nr:mannitol dehydrogenase family protein [Clostridia bacterium]MBQ3270924.1 mannitol dehydrogenase family protein [Clostridia bacterium]
MQLNYKGIQDKAAWEKAGVQLPTHDWKAMCAETAENPVWVHFGAGNIFRIFVAGLMQRLLDAGEAKAGIIAVETFDREVVDRIYVPHDSMTLAVSLLADGGIDKSVVASIAKGVVATDPQGWEELKAIFRKPSLQMLSFTITEKGYALRDMKGELTPVAAADIEAGPAAPKHAMGAVAALLLERFNAGAMPVAVVSMDNCSHNGEKLRAGVTEMARAWMEKGFVPAGFVAWLEDESKVSFPWSMIDKITPRPAEAVEKQLTALGIEDMAPIITEKHTYIAPFVNAEAPQYLVIEDRFPGGRPPLEKAGVYMTDRDTVNMTERMKVTTCLNPLHTALAVYGCLLGYEKICDEMKDRELVALIKRIGYTEGLPVVTDPGILSPKAFIDEVVTQRLPNPFMPDTPQRIACDTSQKVPIRFGETIKSYMADPQRDPATLTAIPLALAGWLRYLLGVDDEGKEMAVSPDPMLAQLQADLNGISLGDPGSVGDKLDALLSNPNLFGVSLVEAGLADKVTGCFKELIAGPGAVRATLKKYLD